MKVHLVDGGKYLYEPLVVGSKSFNQLNNSTFKLYLLVGIIEGSHVTYHMLHNHLYIARLSHFLQKIQSIVLQCIIWILWIILNTSLVHMSMNPKARKQIKWREKKDEIYSNKTNQLGITYLKVINYIQLMLLYKV
jgi:hypothetical protein